MKIKLSLQRSSGLISDIIVTTDAAATVGEVAAAIFAVDPQRAKLGGPPTLATLQIVDSTATAHAVLQPELAIGEVPLGSGATVSIVTPGSAHPVARARPAVALRVIEGPDVGAEFELTTGTKYLGRDKGVSDVTLTDPLVSKRHARIDVFDQSLRFVDLNSANGLEVDGGPVTRIDLGDRGTVRVGDTVLEARISSQTSPSGIVHHGPVPFNRSPRVEVRYPGENLVGPLLPSESDRQPFPWLILAAPMILAPVMFLVSGNATSLIFIAMSPLLVAGNFLSQRATRKRKQKMDGSKFDARFDDLSARLASERDLEREVRLAEIPSTMEVYESAMSLGAMLWTRRPEHWQFLSLNLGKGTLPSRNAVTMNGEEAALPDYLRRLRELIEQYKDVDDVPVAENLHFAGALGVVGGTEAAADYTRGLLVQATGLHSPSELVVAAIVSTGWTAEFEWLKWLPHTASAHSPIEGRHLANSAATGTALLSALEELIAGRKARAVERGAVSIEKSAIVAGATAGEGGAATSPPPSPTPAIIVVISDDAPVDRARLVQMAEDAADSGVFPIWVSATSAGLPAVTRTFVTASQDAGVASVDFVRLGTRSVAVVATPISRAMALTYARRLAPVYDASALLVDSSDLPRTVSMLSLLGPGIAEQPEIAVERWRQNDSIHDRSGGAFTPRRAGRLRAIVGQSGIDAMHLDLRSQGPHALVGGTTGAGKSEFLQAWVLGMAAESSPDRVTFLFVDYKGGSAFADCVSLPHCVGLVTDLSPHLVRRALTSLRAELQFREHLFNRKKVKDLIEFEKSGDPEAPPALVLVIDEFAALAKDVPEFVDGVVDIAQRGRSLGIHLIMATQRPAGVIKDNLRANTNLRIALRMADESDSQDVVGDKIAAGFDPSIPGRAIAKTGPGRVTSFQSAYAGGWTTNEPVIPTIDIADLRFGAEQLWEAPDGRPVDVPADQGPTDQTRLVLQIIKAARMADIPEPRRPWLDELASVFDVTKLSQRTDTEIVLGVTDLPDQQRQEAAWFRPDTDGHLAIFGTGGSGKTVTLRTLAVAAGITPRGGPIDVYGLDFAGNGLRMLDALPHVGAIVAGDDQERVIRVLKLFKAEMVDRSERYASVDASTVTDYRRIANAPEEARLLLLVDGFPAFRADFETTGATAPWYGVFQDIISEGRQLGIHVAITADRPGSVPTAISSGVQRRVVLRLADEAGYSMLDEPKDILSATSPPGRAIVGGRETQIAVVGGTANAVEQARAISALREAIVRSGRKPAPSVGSLPKEIAVSSLPVNVAGNPVLGVSDDDLAPVGFDPTGVFLLAGPPASGRTTAVAWLVASIRRAHPAAQFHYIGPPRSILGTLDGWMSVSRTPDEINETAKALSSTIGGLPDSPKIVVVVEAVADFLSGPADSALVDLIKAVKRSSHFLLAESETSAWSSSWPLLAEVKGARTGLLLQPETMEGDMLLRTAFPRIVRADFPPGRGLFVARGKVVRVQLPFLSL